MKKINLKVVFSKEMLALLIFVTLMAIPVQGVPVFPLVIMLVIGQPVGHFMALRKLDGSSILWFILGYGPFILFLVATAPLVIAQPPFTSVILRPALIQMLIAFLLSAFLIVGIIIAILWKYFPRKKFAFD